MRLNWFFSCLTWRPGQLPGRWVQWDYSSGLKHTRAEACCPFGTKVSRAGTPAPQCGTGVSPVWSLDISKGLQAPESIQEKVSSWPEAYGPGRSAAYLPLPKWRRNAKRPSCLDIISQLRLEMERHPDKLLDFLNRRFPITYATLSAAA